MKIALAQIDIVAQDTQANACAMLNAMEVARFQGVQVLFFPELCISGYLVGDAWERQDFLQECLQQGKRIRDASGEMFVVFGNVGLDESKIGNDGRIRKYNAFYCAHQGEFLLNSAVNFEFWPKILLPNYREFDESRYFFDLRLLAVENDKLLSSYVEPLNIAMGNESITFGVGICEDGWSADYGLSPYDILSQKGADIFVNLSCSPFSLGKLEKRVRVFGNHAQKYTKNFLYVNGVGVQNNSKTIFGFDGRSSVFSDCGKCIAEGAFFKSDLLTLEIFKNELNTLHLNVLSNHIQLPQLPKVEQIYLGLCAILRETLKQWKINHVVIGLSGGIDSALSAVLFTHILGRDKVTAVNMPSRFNSQLTKNAAHLLAKNLGIAYAVLPISESIHATEKELRNVIFENSSRSVNLSSLVCENIQARDRGGRILAALAASLNGVFTCNANKSETTVGYSTLYGDLAGFLCPLGDLWKEDVYALSRYFNIEIFKSEIIPTAIFDVKPSAELSENQDVMQNKGDPLCYPYHDALFKSWTERWNRWSPYDVLKSYANGTLAAEIGVKVEIIEGLFKSHSEFVNDLERWWGNYVGMGAFKRVQAPPIVGLTARSYGNDHRECLGPFVFSQAYIELKNKLLQNIELIN